MRCSCPYLGVEQAGNTLFNLSATDQTVLRCWKKNCDALMDVTVFSGSGPRPLHVFLFMNKSPGSSREWTKNTLAGVASVTSPHFFPQALLWYVILCLFVRFMHTVHEYNRRHSGIHTCMHNTHAHARANTHTRTVPDPQQAISLTSRATAVLKNRIWKCVLSLPARWKAR